MESTDIAVVGGGIAGASIAYHLAAATDARIDLFERGELAAETTAKSAAFFGFYGSAAERRMKRFGLGLYNEFLAAPRTGVVFDLVGRVRVATTPGGARDLADAAADTGPTAPSPNGPVSGTDLQETMLLPALDPTRIERALYQPHVGYFEPRQLAFEFIERAREHGAELHPDTPVVDLAVADGRITGIGLEDGTVETGTVICAAGPWTPTVAGWAGVDLPITHSLAPIIKLDPGRQPHTLPIVAHVESGVYARGHRDGSVLVGRYPTDEPTDQVPPDSMPASVPADVARDLRGVIDDVLPGLSAADRVDEWVGVRSHTPDGHPIAGETAVDGLWVAAFHSSGIQLSPAVGDHVAAAVLGGRPGPWHDTVTPTRFRGGPP